MNIASTSHFRQYMKRYFDEVDQTQEPLIVTRPDNVSVVVIPLATYNSYTETDYLLRSKANARHLRRSLEDAQADQVTEHPLHDI